MGNERSEKQNRYIVDHAKQSGLPAIVAGDFNLRPSAPSFPILTQYFTVFEKQLENDSSPSELMKVSLQKPIDYILINDHIRAGHGTVVDIDASDHLPHILDFTIVRQV